MKYLLPHLTERFPFFSSGRNFFESKRTRYKLAALLDLVLIAAILMSAKAPVQRLASPLVPAFHSLYTTIQVPVARETFAFAPDLAPNKFTRINLEHLTYLSFFDVPVADNGQLRVDSRGYASFSSNDAAALFDRVRYQKGKVFLTLTAFDTQIIGGILESSDAQQTLADEAIREITNSSLDGITIDFEFPQGSGREYQDKFSDFLSLLKTRVHLSLPNAQVAVAVPSNLTDNQSIYNIEALGKNTDKIFLIASNFIVPEVQDAILINPIYGINSNEYWPEVSKVWGSLQKRVPVDKLVLERAWYGNGNYYPLYVPDGTAGPGEKRAATASLDEGAVDRLVAGVPQKGQEAARRNIPIIAEALKNEGILDTNVLAYALATVEHETDETFEPIAEIQGSVNARRFGYEGGENYFGRGFIQITHLRNYRRYSERVGLGDQLVKNPELASQPDIAAKILAAFFKDNNVANLASQGDFVDARTPINPDYNGYAIANIAMKYDIQQ